MPDWLAWWPDVEPWFWRVLVAVISLFQARLAWSQLQQTKRIHRLEGDVATLLTRPNRRQPESGSEEASP